MLYISDGLLLNYLEANEKQNIEKFINDKRFTVSDTPLSYRQVNTLDSDNLLGENRKNKQGWRKFSFKELVYIVIVNDLKQFGLKHDQLKDLWNSFFALPKPVNGEFQINKGMADIAIGCTFGHVEITLCIDSGGNVKYYDPGHYALLHQNNPPQIQISLNIVVNHLLKKMGEPTFEPIWTVDQTKPNLTSKEDELLKIIRDKNFNAIKINKKGEELIIHAETNKSELKDTNVEKLIEILNSKDYQDITIIKRDGKIVNYKVEETIKL